MAISLQERAAARLQSFTTKAVVVLVLYWMFWIPGFIANAVFYNEAKRMERISDESLPGTGCLAAMLWLNAPLIAIGVIAGLCFLSLLTSGRLHFGS